MDRRKFVSMSGVGAAAVAAGSVAGSQKVDAAPSAAGGSCASAKLPPLKARLGHQFGTLTDRVWLLLSASRTDDVLADQLTGPPDAVRVISPSVPVPRSS